MAGGCGDLSRRPEGHPVLVALLITPATLAPGEAQDLVLPVGASLQTND